MMKGVPRSAFDPAGAYGIEMPTDGSNPDKWIAGLNRTKKALKSGIAAKVYLATDADMHFTATVTALAEEYGVPVEISRTMAELGALSGIDVGCAVCVLEK